jgi:hypothetical protein
MRRKYYCVQARTPEELTAVCRIRHEAYRESDAAAGAGPGPMVMDEYDGRPNCPSFALHREGEPGILGAIRPCVYDPKRPDLLIPAFDYFKEEIENHCGMDVRIVQSTHFVLSPSVRGIDFISKFTLFREVLRMADLHQAAFITTAVRNRASHLDFFAHMGFQPQSEPRWIPGFSNYAVLLAVDIPTAMRCLKQRSIYSTILDFPHQYIR